MLVKSPLDPPIVEAEILALLPGTSKVITLGFYIVSPLGIRDYFSLIITV
jgi:hypothetical protein